MREDVRFEMPLSPPGTLGEPTARRRLRRLVDSHAEALRELVEGDGWCQFHRA